MLRLKRVMDGKGVPLEKYAELLGMSKKTLYNKAIGESDFSYPEYQKLKALFPEYNIDYLLTEEPPVA